jgi:hypothetical protein
MHMSLQLSLGRIVGERRRQLLEARGAISQKITDCLETIQWISHTSTLA